LTLFLLGKAITEFFAERKEKQSPIEAFLRKLEQTDD
jgi:hypothetical protein